MGAVFLEDSRWRKFTQLVSNHVFRDEDGVKNLPIMHQERVTHELRCNGGPARPRLYWTLRSAVVHFVDLLEQVLLNEGTFLEGSAHS